MDNDFDGDEMAANLLYRSAFGEAHRIVEMRGWNFAHGRDRVRDVALEVDAMARDIARRRGVEPEAIRDAVDDALSGGRPRW